MKEVSNLFSPWGGVGEPPQADEGQNHHNSEAQSKDKGWKEGINGEICGGQQEEGWLRLCVAGEGRRERAERKKGVGSEKQSVLLCSAR